MKLRSIGIFLLFLMFFLSGCMKIYNFFIKKEDRKKYDNKQIEKLSSKYISVNTAEYIVLVAGLLEVICCLLIYNKEFGNILNLDNINLDNQIRLSSYSLIFFTILVTIIYKIKPFNKWGFFSNLSVIGGILLYISN